MFAPPHVLLPGPQPSAVYPADPGDDGFVRAGTSHRTPAFFAGFTDAYAYQYRIEHVFLGANPIDSYDRGFGYMFVIASWRPMRFDLFSNAGSRDKYELTDEASMIDPRAADHELASVLVGDAREAYTISFASYLKTQWLPGASLVRSAALGSAFCSAVGPKCHARVHASPSTTQCAVDSSSGPSVHSATAPSVASHRAGPTRARAAGSRAVRP